MEQPKLAIRAAAPTPHHPPLLTPEDVAARLGVSRKALERWRCTGDGPRFVRLGHKTVRYRHQDIETFISARIVASTAMS
ncbi:helix-turn-helix transcriptional regulator [Teichococcus oryzae]|uniref:Helix-turn-helix domain-containing protein n=1 Tax=Teichococcus oryzae TaxID=1608942 RepID=A0A5B2TGH3_9PROT|nr:helix-turn-helix domain-containing protein [Pseudoroseomonas oryzae]KAA2213203.1 helix-turn-helix domain-containing protein [Pseudoroseomonas oryzae]